MPTKYDSLSTEELDRLIAAEEKGLRQHSKPRGERRRKGPYHERGTWQAGKGIANQDQCITMQLTIGGAIVLWVRLSQVRRRPRPGVSPQLCRSCMSCGLHGSCTHRATQQSTAPRRGSKVWRAARCGFGCCNTQRCTGYTTATVGRGRLGLYSMIR